MTPAALNNLESPLSMIEKTAKRILPVISAVQKCLIRETSRPGEGSGMAEVQDAEEEDEV